MTVRGREGQAVTLILWLSQVYKAAAVAFNTLTG